MRARVVLIDPDRWDSLGSWGAALRTRGVSVCSVRSNRDSLLRRVRDRLVFGEWPAPSLQAALSRGVASDIVTTEEEMARMSDDGSPLDARTPHVSSECAPSLLWNKWDMTVFAERLGLSVPETWSDDPELLPLVVKGRVGAGGRAVRLVYSEEQRDAAVRELGTDVFFQDVVHGDLINVSGVARQGEVCLLVAYRAIAAQDDPLGPPTRLEIIDAQGPVSEATLLLKALDYTGLVALDFILSADGRWWLLDVNPRPFGGWLALQRSGVDLVGSYLALIDLAEMPSLTPPTPGMVLDDQLLPIGDPGGFGDALGAATASWQRIVQAARITGWWFALPVGVRSTRHSLGQVRAVLHRRAKEWSTRGEVAAAPAVAPPE